MWEVLWREAPTWLVLSPPEGSRAFSPWRWALWRVPSHLAEGLIMSQGLISEPDIVLMRPRWQNFKDMTKTEAFLGSYLLYGFCLDSILHYPTPAPITPGPAPAPAKAQATLKHLFTTVFSRNEVFRVPPPFPTEPNFWAKILSSVMQEVDILSLLKQCDFSLSLEQKSKKDIRSLLLLQDSPNMARFCSFPTELHGLYIFTWFWLWVEVSFPLIFPSPRGFTCKCRLSSSLSRKKPQKQREYEINHTKLPNENRPCLWNSFLISMIFPCKHVTLFFIR